MLRKITTCYRVVGLITSRKRNFKNRQNLNKRRIGPLRFQTSFEINFSASKLTLGTTV